MKERGVSGFSKEERKWWRFYKTIVFHSCTIESGRSRAVIIIVIIQVNITASSRKTTIYGFIMGGGRAGRWWLWA
jgi:hypothetical protein